MTKYLPDTNALLNHPHFLESLDGEIIVSYVVLQELDKIKSEIGTARGFQARQAVRVLKKLGDKVVYDFQTQQYTTPSGSWIVNNDDKIVGSARDFGAVLVTGDYLMQLKAKAHDLEVVEVDEVSGIDGHIDYTGIKEMYLDTRLEADNLTLESFYKNKQEFAKDMLKNQYGVFWDLSQPKYNSDGILMGYELIDTFKFNGSRISNLQYAKIENHFTGKVNPLNVKQRLLFDLLQNDDITVKATFGSFGVGKDYVMISHAVDMLMKNKIDKIVWVRNNVEVKDSNQIGFLPNSMEDKLLPFAMPLADHLGGVDGLYKFIASKQIEIQHLGFMRGRDIKNAIVYVTECENNTKEHIQLLLGRISKGSMLWLNGDIKQVDADKFVYNNGVNSVKKLMGQQRYGQVTLDKVERSETAMLADLLD